MLTTIRYNADKGRGIFAKKKIRSGTVIEVCPLLLIDAIDWKKIKRTCLAHYVFEWNDGGVAIALGQGSLYNHSENPNCKTIWPTKKDLLRNSPTFTYIATRTIQKNEEICIDYGYKPYNYSEKSDSGLLK